jgi:DNA-binding response OmpR family regulator
MSRSRRHILLVEEHRDIRAAFAGLFEGIYGYALHIATETREAVGITGRQSVDVAVVDLPTGTEQSARLAMIRTWRRDGLVFPVIATTSSDHDGLLAKTFEAGGDDFLRKPYLFGELRARIQRQLARQLNQVPKVTRLDGVILPDDSFEFAGATITPDLRITFPDGQVSKLGAKHVGMLREFNLHAGSLLFREKLIYAVWGADANMNSTSVHQYLYVLRKLYRERGVDLNAFVTPESKVGWRIAKAREPMRRPPSIHDESA